MVEILRHAADVHGDVEAYVEPADPLSDGVVAAGADGRRRLTFSQWDAAADGVAALLAERGVARGDVVCLLLPSSIDYAVVLPGGHAARCPHHGINLRLGRREQASITARSCAGGHRRRRRPRCRPRTSPAAGAVYSQRAG